MFAKCGPLFQRARCEHPTKTWACATHKQFTVVGVGCRILLSSLLALSSLLPSRTLFRREEDPTEGHLPRNQPSFLTASSPQRFRYHRSHFSQSSWCAGNVTRVTSVACDAKFCRLCHLPQSTDFQLTSSFQNEWSVTFDPTCAGSATTRWRSPAAAAVPGCSTATAQKCLLLASETIYPGVG